MLFQFINFSFFVKCQEITFFTNGGTHKRYEEVPEEVGTTSGGCNSYQNKNLRVNFEVPPVPPTDCQSSNIIHIEYSIHVSAILSGI